MATIDNLDISVYNLYAIRTLMVEQINKDLQIDKASSIPPQTSVVDIYPRLNEMEMLLGVTAFHTPWAYFFPPKKFSRIRKAPFSFSKVIPSLGSEEDQEEKMAALEAVPCSTEQEREEKAILKKCFEKIDWINDMMSFIVGRVGQFLQG